jgi:nickel/cobalt transporter (NiCoT) family protein
VVGPPLRLLQIDVGPIQLLTHHAIPKIVLLQTGHGFQQGSRQLLDASLVELLLGQLVVKREGLFVAEDIDRLLANRGLIGRLFRRFFKAIERSWQMYPLGVLFGLGFDTATEVGLLGISAAQASQGLSIWSILVFPALFTAGMTFIDTTDSVLMVGAYSGAFVKPIRKLYYNLTITAVSVIVAVLIGGIEALNLISDQLGLSDEGAFWRVVAALSDDFGLLGYLIVGFFIFAWLISYVVYWVNRYDEIEIKVYPSACMTSFRTNS